WCEGPVWPRRPGGGDGTASADAVNPPLGASAATSLALPPAESVPSPPPSRVQYHVPTTRLATEWLSNSAGGRIVVGSWQRTCWGGGQGKGRRNLRGRTPRRATRMYSCVSGAPYPAPLPWHRVQRVVNEFFRVDARGFIREHQ